jgi:hypothetical protein
MPYTAKIIIGQSVGSEFSPEVAADLMFCQHQLKNPHYRAFFEMESSLMN